MNKRVSFAEQLDFLMNITSIMMDLVSKAENLGINLEGKTRAELVKEIQQVENDSYLVGAH